MSTALTPFEIDARDEAIARAVAGGASKDRIATAYGLTPAGLDSILHKDVVQSRITELRERLQLALQAQQQYREALLPTAMSIADQVMQDPTHRDRTKVALEIIKMSAPQLVHQSGTVGLALQMSDDTAQALAKALGEAMAARNAHPDVPPITQDERLIEAGRQ